MFPSKKRADKKAIKKIFKDGRFVNSLNLTLKFVLSKGSFSSKISFITPKNVSKKAVIRNLMRRRGYAVLKKYFDKFPAGFSGVFIFGRKSATVFGGRKNKTRNPVLNLENEIKNILNRI